MAALCGILLCARALLGPFYFVVPVHRTLNLQSVFGLASTLALLLGSFSSERNDDSPPSLHFDLVDVGLSAGIVLAVISAFYANLASSFLSDDLYLLTIAQHPEAFRKVLFVHGGGQEFFRPVGGMALFVSHWLAGANPHTWHAFSLALHALNGLLVYTLARQLFAGKQIAGVAAVLFCFHGVTPEAVTWMAGRFDLLATCFTLVSLVCFVASQNKDSRGMLVASLTSGALALLAKESAYALPVLITCIASARSESLKDLLRRTAPYWFLTVIMFLLRFASLGGIGGYVGAGSTSQVLSVSALGIIKATALRIWSAFYIPVNWSVEPSPDLALMMALGVAAIVYTAAFSSPNSTSLRLAAAMCLAATLPPLHQLLIDTDLQKSRMLYLPLVGFCLFLGVAVGSLQRQRTLWLVAFLLLAFHAAALRHNLAIWRSVADLADGVCEEIASKSHPAPQVFS